MSSRSNPQQTSACVPRRAMYAWGVGGTAEGLMAAAVGGVFMQVFNTGFGIEAFWVSLAITIPRLVDAFTDPLIGYFSDNLKTRWGRRRPFMFVSCIVIALLNAAIWWLPPGWPVAAQVVWLILFSTLFWQAWGCYTIPRMALGYELTDDYHERTKVMATNMFFSIIPGLFTGWTYWLCLRPFFAGEINGIRWVSLGLSVLVILIGILPALYCRERFTKPPSVHYGFFRSVGQTFQNRAFVYHVAIRAVQAVGNSIAGGFSFYVSWQYVCRGNKDLASQLVGWGTSSWVVIAFVMIPITPWIGRKLGKRTGMLIGLGGLAFAASLGPLLLNPSYPYLCLLGSLFSGPAQIISGLFLASFMADICDLDELKSGLRREGLYSAVDKFIGKLELSLLVLLTGVLLTFSGFDAKADVQTPEVVRNMLWWFFGAGIACPFLTLALAWNFPINHKLMLDVRRQLDERHAASETPHPLS